MTDRHAELDAALERVISAARVHLTAVKSADGRPDDDGVWQAYVELNNASFEYDELLLDAFREVTPWDVEAIDPDEAVRQFGIGVEGDVDDDPYPRVVSVRQRRDYRVPSVSALLSVAESARRAGPLGDEEPLEAVSTVGEALLEIMQAGDGSLGALDIPELESLNGVVVVAEVETSLEPEEYADGDGDGAFRLVATDRLVDRLDEHAYLDFDDEDDDEDEDEDDEVDEDEEDEDDGDDEVVEATGVADAGDAVGEQEPAQGR
jgi:copper chaperone CopZ